MLGVSLLVALVVGQSDDQDWPPKSPPTQAQTTAAQQGPLSPAAPKEAQTFLVLDLTVGPDIRPELSKALSDQLTILIRQSLPQGRVLGMEDVRTMMALQAQRSRLNCADVSCLAEIGGALGAKEVVNGSLARIGDNYVLTVKRVNAKQVKVIADATRQVPRDHESDLIDALKGEVGQLFPRTDFSAEELFGESEPQSVTKKHTTSYWLLGTAGVGIAAVIVGAILYEQFQSAKATAAQPNTQVTVDTIASDHDQAVVGTALLLAGATVAAGGTLGSVIAW
jgi:hypothetical protein